MYNFFLDFLLSFLTFVHELQLVVISVSLPSGFLQCLIVVSHLRY